MKQLSLFNKGFDTHLYDVPYGTKSYIIFSYKNEMMLYIEIGHKRTPAFRNHCLKKAQGLVDMWNCATTVPDFTYDAGKLAKELCNTYAGSMSGSLMRARKAFKA